MITIYETTYNVYVVVIASLLGVLAKTGLVQEQVEDNCINRYRHVTVCGVKIVSFFQEYQMVTMSDGMYVDREVRLPLTSWRICRCGLFSGNQPRKTARDVASAQK